MGKTREQAKSKSKSKSKRKSKRRKSAEERQLDAARSVIDALRPFDEPGRERVLRFARSFFVQDDDNFAAQTE